MPGRPSLSHDIRSSGMLVTPVHWNGSLVPLYIHSPLTSEIILTRITMSSTPSSNNQSSKTPKLSVAIWYEPSLPSLCTLMILLQWRRNCRTAVSGRAVEARRHRGQTVRSRRMPQRDRCRPHHLGQSIRGPVPHGTGPRYASS